MKIRQNETLKNGIVNQDIAEEVVTLTEDKLVFAGKGGDKLYSVELEFMKPVDTEHADSKWAKTGRGLLLQIMKKDKEEEEHWPRIQKEKGKVNWLQPDWSRYVDEDEEDEKPDTGMDVSRFSGT